MNKKQIVRINESQLRQIVAESVKRVLNEEYNDFISNVNFNELIRKGETYVGDICIFRNSSRYDAILEISLYNSDDGREGKARVGLGGELLDDYKYAVQIAYQDMLK